MPLASVRGQTPLAQVEPELVRGAHPVLEHRIVDVDATDLVRVGRSAGVAGGVARGVLLEDTVDDPTARDDRRVVVECRRDANTIVLEDVPAGGDLMRSQETSERRPSFIRPRAR